MKLRKGTISAQTPLQWATINTIMGRCLVVRVKNDGAICALYLGEDKDALCEQLPDWNLTPMEGDEALEQQLGNAFRGEPCDLEVMLDVTDFRFKVLETLTQNVGFGQTVTYSDLARMCGCPDAVRAVASALAGNQVAVLVPCHRVVPKAGGVGQYRWGESIKSKIQNYEKSIKR